MKSVFVTGASGFIGKNLIRKLKNKKYEFYQASSIQGDISSPQTWNSFEACDILVHLAAKSFVPESWEHPQRFMQDNLIGTINGLEYCKRNNSKFIFLSSYLYGNVDKLPISESFPTIANNPYGLSKLLSEEACFFYKKIHNLDITILRVFNVYGKYQPENFLISKILSHAIDKQQIILNSLIPRRDYLYIDDLITAILCAFSYEGNENIFNIGLGKSYSVKEVIKIIEEILGYDLSINCRNISRRNEIFDTVADIRLAKKELDWAPIYDLKDGIREMHKRITV